MRTLITKTTTQMVLVNKQSWLVFSVAQIAPAGLTALPVETRHNATGAVCSSGSALNLQMMNDQCESRNGDKLLEGLSNFVTKDAGELRNLK